MSQKELFSCPKEATLYQNFALCAKKDLSHDALIFQNKHFSYGHVLDKVQRFASSLIDLGIKKDDVVTVCLPNIPEAIYLLFAINQIGAIGNMVHPLFNLEQMRENMNLTGSHLLFCLDQNFDKFIPLLAENKQIYACSPVSELNLIKRLAYQMMNKNIKNIPLSNRLNKFYQSEPYLECDQDYKKDAIYLHSGGTTGKSKTIALSCFSMTSLCANGKHILERYQNVESLHMLAVLPMFHGFGLTMGVLALLFHGGTLTLMPKFSTKETINYLAKNEINYIIGIPTLFEALLSKEKFSGKKLQNLYICFVGGDFVSESLIKRFNQRMLEAHSNCLLLEGYGLTETVTVCAVNRLSEHKKGAVGKPLPNVKFKIVDSETKKDLGVNQSGELYISGETLMNGYRFTNKEANQEVFVTDEKGVKWVKTGDCCLLDEDNYLVFKQRLKRIIKVNGIPVFPSNIEDAVMDLGFVYECAAIGVEDAKRGHMIKLFVVLNRNYQIANPDEIINEAIIKKEGIYAKPKEIVYLEKMPHTLVGKIDTKELK